jgi:hypothetical protein
VKIRTGDQNEVEGLRPELATQANAPRDAGAGDFDRIESC